MVFAHSEAANERMAQLGLTLARCMKVTREDGTIFRLTEHDQKIEIFEGFFNGSSDSYSAPTDYSPVDGWDASNARAESAMKESNMELTGVFGGSLVTSADIRAGLWDNAKVEDFRVDWKSPWLGVYRHQIYRIGDFRFDGEIWTAQAYNTYSEFHRKHGKVFSRTCHFAFGDSNCGVNVRNAGTTMFQCTVSDYNSSTSHNITMNFADGSAPYDGARSKVTSYFKAGHIEWIDGANAGQTYPVASNTNGANILSLVYPTRAKFTIGETFWLFAGCDKRHTTCKSATLSGGVSNIPRFGGFPWIPGNATLSKSGNIEV